MKNIFWSIGSALGTAAILYATMPLPVAIVVMVVLLTHELGHYLMGRFTGAQAYWPVFIPLILFVIGVTRIKNVSAKFKSLVAIAGPVAGVFVAAALCLIALLISSPLMFFVALSALAYEVWAGTLGSDGRRFRKSRKDMIWV